MVGQDQYTEVGRLIQMWSSTVYKGLKDDNFAWPLLMANLSTCRPKVVREEVCKSLISLSISTINLSKLPYRTVEEINSDHPNHTM